MCAGGNWAIRDFFVEQAGLWMRNPGNVIIRCKALVTSFGGLILGCIEADFLQVLSYDSKYNFCGIQDFRTFAPSQLQLFTNVDDLFDKMLTKVCQILQLEFSLHVVKCWPEVGQSLTKYQKLLAPCWQNINYCWRRIWQYLTSLTICLTRLSHSIARCFQKNLVTIWLKYYLLLFFLQKCHYPYTSSAAQKRLGVRRAVFHNLGARTWKADADHRSRRFAEASQGLLSP